MQCLHEIIIYIPSYIEIGEETFYFCGLQTGYSIIDGMQYQELPTKFKKHQ